MFQVFLFFGWFQFSGDRSILPPGCLFGTFVLWWPTDDLDIVTLPMNGERLEPWQQLCELAVREQDRDHLVELIRVIDRLIAQKERRLQKRPPNAKRSLELNRH
ncbi:MAG: hypothetical protein JOZ14_00020 [Acidobacteria bacterium]|nr:hypothetical protein [Acidobacteriota bacterium]